MSKIFKALLFSVSIIVLISGCKIKHDNDVKDTPTPETYSHSTQVNQFEHIGYYLGEWISENHTEIIEDGEGIPIESTDDDKMCDIVIRLNEQNEPEVYIGMMSKITKAFEGTFKVAFDEKGTAIINDLDDEIKSIKIELGYNRYSISVDFVYDDKTEYMGFIRLDEYIRIARCMEIVRDKISVNSNKIDNGEYIIRYSSMDDYEIIIIVSRVEDTVVRARYIFDPNTLEYRVE